MIITHGDLDGLVSALVAMEISGQKPNDVHFFSYEPDRDEKWNTLLVHHKSSFQMSDDNVWFVNISLRPGELEHARLPHKASKWHWVDHHKSSLEFNPEGIFDKVYLDTSGEKCAADILMGMVWDRHECVELNPSILFLQEWVDIAHDRDLWINEHRERNLKLDMILKAHLGRGRGRELLMYCLTAKPDDIIQQLAFELNEMILTYRKLQRQMKSTSNDVFVGTEPCAVTVEMPCFSCDEPVEVMLPFYGCVYCAECMVSEGYGVADAPEFKVTLWC